MAEVAIKQEVAPKELKPQVLRMEGISERQIEEHYNVLYKGYVNKLNEIRAKLPDIDRSKANQTYSDHRAAKVGETFAVNGVRLHEDYFGNLGGSGGRANGRILELIERDFGSYEAWEADFKATGIAVRGWAVLAYDWHDHRLHNYGQDAHDAGAIWSAMPLLVLDVYEHAYFIDYGTKRAPYIEAFMKNVDWDVVNQRAEHIKP